MTRADNVYCTELHLRIDGRINNGRLNRSESQPESESEAHPGPTLTTGLFPAKAATTLPHHFSLHQATPQPPVASSPFPVGSGAGSSVDPGEGREGTLMSCARDQSEREGSREVWIRRCESVEMDACAGRRAEGEGIRMRRGATESMRDDGEGSRCQRYRCQPKIARPNRYDHHEPRTRLEEEAANPRRATALRTILRPTDGLGGLNSTPLTDPFAPESTARSTHRPALPEEDGGSSQIRTVRSWEHEARREPCSGWAKERRRIGAS